MVPPNQCQAPKLGNTTEQDRPVLQLVQAHYRLMQTSRTQTAAKSAMKQNKPSGETPGSL